MHSGNCSPIFEHPAKIPEYSRIQGSGHCAPAAAAPQIVPNQHPSSPPRLAPVPAASGSPWPWKRDLSVLKTLSVGNFAQDPNPSACSGPQSTPDTYYPVQKAKTGLRLQFHSRPNTVIKSVGNLYLWTRSPSYLPNCKRSHTSGLSVNTRLEYATLPSTPCALTSWYRVIDKPRPSHQSKINTKANP